MGATTTANGTGNDDLPFAKELFEAADRLRGSVESAELIGRHTPLDLRRLHRLPGTQISLSTIEHLRIGSETGEVRLGVGSGYSILKPWQELDDEPEVLGFTASATGINDRSLCAALVLRLKLEDTCGDIANNPAGSN